MAHGHGVHSCRFGFPMLTGLPDIDIGTMLQSRIN